MSQGKIRECEYPTFSGKQCKRPGIVQGPGGKWFCGIPHVRGTAKSSGGRNGPCSCGSHIKHKSCCAVLPKGASRVINSELEVQAPEQVDAIVWSRGYNPRRWVIGYDYDATWRGHTFYFGPWWISRRHRLPR